MKRQAIKQAPYSTAGIRMQPQMHIKQGQL